MNIADCDIGAYELDPTPLPAALSLTTHPVAIPADGVSTSILIATLTSAEGEPVPRQVVSFSATLGSCQERW